MSILPDGTYVRGEHVDDNIAAEAPMAEGTWLNLPEIADKSGLSKLAVDHPEKDFEEICSVDLSKIRAEVLRYKLSFLELDSDVYKSQLPQIEQLEKDLKEQLEAGSEHLDEVDLAIIGAFNRAFLLTKSRAGDNYLQDMYGILINVVGAATSKRIKDNEEELAKRRIALRNDLIAGKGVTTIT